MKHNAVAKILSRALSATEAEGLAHPWDQIDLVVAQAMLNGVSKISDLAAESGLTEHGLRQRLLDAARCRWLSMELEKAVDSRLGLVIGAVYAAALRTGDPNRARFLIEHFREKRPERHLHLHAALDLSQLSNEELTAFVKDRRRVLGIVEDVKDVPYDAQERDASAEDSGSDGGGIENTPSDETGAAGGSGKAAA